MPGHRKESAADPQITRPVPPPGVADVPDRVRAAIASLAPIGADVRPFGADAADATSGTPTEPPKDAWLPSRVVVEGVDVGRTGLVDYHVLVYRPASYPSLLSLEQHVAVHQIIGERVGTTEHEPTSEILPVQTPAPTERRRPIAHDAILPMLRCGETLATGHRCGSRLLQTLVRGRLQYSTGNCCAQTPRHSTIVPVAEIDNAVLAMIADAYTPAAVEKGIQSIEARIASAEDALPKLQEAARTAELSAVHAGKRVIQEEAAARFEEAESWNRVRQEFEADAAEYRRQAASLRQTLDERGRAGAIDRAMQVVRSLATHLERLFEAGRDRPTVLARFIRATTRGVAYRQVGKFLGLVEVEFPNGGVARRLLVTHDLACSHAMRALAYGLLQQGWTPAEASRYLAQADGYGGVGTTPNVINSLALLHRFMEAPAVDRSGGATIEVWAERLEEPVATVLRAACDGLLGPGLINSAGVVRVAPTPDELEAAMPSVARRRLAKRYGVAPNSLFHVQNRSHKMRIERAIRDGVLARKAYVTDRAGRAWLRLDVAGPSFSDMDAARHAARLAAAIRDAVVAAGYHPDSAGDFYFPFALARHFRPRFPGIGSNRFDASWLVAPSVPYAGPGRGPGLKPPSRVVYCPPDVMMSDDRGLVLRWMAGELPGPERAASDGPTRRRRSRGT